MSEFQFSNRSFATKLAEIRAHLTLHQGQVLQYESSVDDYLTTSELAHKLFAKAPSDFLERRTSEELVAITDKAITLIEAVLSDRTTHEITVLSDHKSTCIYIAQGDKPFIINTITELFRKQELSIRVFLHPILRHLGYRLSLAYIECDFLSAEQLKLLEKTLHALMNDLRIVTEDFTSMLVKVETLARMLSNQKYTSIFPLSEQTEVADFLHWLSDGGYIFLGHANWRVEEGNLAVTPASQLGLFQDLCPLSTDLLCEARSDAEKLLELSQPVMVSRLRTESPVHRRSRLNNIVILESAADGTIHSIHAVIGLFTSKALTQESSSVPLIRRKLKLLSDKEELYENSFDFKTTVNIIDSMPKDEAFRLDLDSLREIVTTIVGIQNRNETRASIRFDPTRRGVSLLIIMPRDRFNSHIRDRLQNHLERTFGAAHGTSEYHLDLTNKPHARLYFYVPLPDSAPPMVDLARLEDEIAELSRTWKSNLEDALLASQSAENAQRLWLRYSNAFPESYQALQSPTQAVYDIENLENLYHSDEFSVFGLDTDSAGAGNTLTLILYHQDKEITLSKILPLLENLGLEVISEQSSSISPVNYTTAFIHRFLVRTKRVTVVTHELFHSKVHEALVKLFVAKVENDPLNSLCISAALSIKEISLIRSYCHFLWQVNKFATREVVYTCLADHPDKAKKLYDIFETRFNPDLVLQQADRVRKFQKQLRRFRESLQTVSDITSDRILRSLAILIEHTVRTNFYHTSGCFAFKLHSQEVAILPHPRPLYEIFVDSPKLQGTHLRTSPIARGGIRWSDRYEDFRSEILGLVKTQNIKNALIVPSGAKGGFVVQHLSSDRDTARTQVEQGYRTYIRALLSVTDNRVNGEVQHPQGLIIYDGPDPYFVVAADKGTATFSDLANKIASEESNFWLNDAFASGGSQGYDHKLYGITARGAWECVIRHFKDLGINYEESPFSVVGIGDMSGDVFGNGMLLSNKIRLLAAFNHKHIFIDPDPDPTASFEERKRLFNTPGSQWSDYQQTVISPGGGIFNRFDKSIPISPEIRSAIQLPEDIADTINGEELIAHILRTPCDLLWNGGIGTYVKSQIESHTDVNDGTNDRVRVNAGELRARIVGEGGNLGFTQLARIEYAQKGGRINTDAIDNSAGVDLSDHEVNIKILMSSLEADSKITREERNRILKDIADEVVSHVLSHNTNHALVLSLGVHRSSRNIAYFRTLIRELHRAGYFNRTLEYLPDDEELQQRALNKQGLERPELAICLGGVKMFVTEEVSKGDIVDSPLVEPFLLDYFPEYLRINFKEHILNHALAGNIIATQIANSLIDTMGITFVHRMSLVHALPSRTVISSAVAAQLILDTPSVLRSIAGFDTFKTTPTFLSLRKEVNAALRESTAWFFRYHRESDLGAIVHEYRERYEALLEEIETTLSGEAHTLFLARKDNYIRQGIALPLASRLASFPCIEILFELLWIAQQANKPNALVSRVYTAIIEKLGIDSIVSLGEQASSNDKFENELLMASLEDIKKSIACITCRFLAKDITESEQVKETIGNSIQFTAFESLVADLLERTASPAGIAVIARHLSQFE